MKQKGTKDDSESSTASSEADDSASEEEETDEEPEDLEAIHWVAPSNGFVRLSRDANGMIPLCSKRIFVQNRCVQGQGVTNAAATNRPWCPKCLTKGSHSSERWRLLRDATR